MTTPIEAVAKALVARVASDEALMHDDMTEEEWGAIYDSGVEATAVSNGIVERVDGAPESLARIVFGSIGEDGLINVLIVHSESVRGGCVCGWKRGEVTADIPGHQAREIKAWLNGTEA